MSVAIRQVTIRAGCRALAIGTGSSSRQRRTLLRDGAQPPGGSVEALFAGPEMSYRTWSRRAGAARHRRALTLSTNAPAVPMH